MEMNFSSAPRATEGMIKKFSEEVVELIKPLPLSEQTQYNETTARLDGPYTAYETITAWGVVEEETGSETYEEGGIVAVADMTVDIPGVYSANENEFARVRERVYRIAHVKRMYYADVSAYRLFLKRAFEEFV